MNVLWELQCLRSLKSNKQYYFLTLLLNVSIGDAARLVVFTSTGHL